MDDWDGRIVYGDGGWGGRELSSELGTFEILFFRSLIGLFIVGLLLAQSDWRQILSKHLGLHTIPNLAHFGGQFGWFYGIALIPLAEVFAIEFTVPVWTAILASLLLKERLTRGRIAAIVLGFIGMLIILRPGIAVISPAALAVLAGVIAYALSHTLTRRLAFSRHTALHTLLYDRHPAAPRLDPRNR